MEINNANSNSQVFVGDASKGLQNAAKKSGNEKVEEKAAFADAAKIDITDPNAKKADRELSSETQAFFVNSGIEIAQESANFDKQSVLNIAGSITAAQGNANTATSRALLS